MNKNIFFGRQDCISALEKRISDLKNGYRQNIAIIGDESIGKTTLVLNFLKRFHDSRIIALYIDIHQETLLSFARRFIGALLYNFLLNSGASLKEDLEFLIEKSSKHIPETVKKIHDILEAINRRKKSDVFYELLMLCNSVNQETGKYCLVVWDEFCNLQNLEVKDLYPQWSKALVLQKTTMHVLISSSKFKAKSILSSDLSLLFGNFELIHVGPFDTKTSGAYLKNYLGESRINPGVQDFIVHFTGGHPFYLQAIASAITKASQEDIVSILEGLLFDPAGALNMRFLNYLNRFNRLANAKDFISILHSVSNGHNKLKDIGHILRKQKKEINSRINYLFEQDFVLRNADFISISDRVFSFWLKVVHLEKLNSLTHDQASQKKYFRHSLNAMMADFTSHATKPMRERVKDVLQLFANETILIENKKLKLHHFNEIKPLDFNKSALRDGLIGRSNDGLWVMAMKKDSITEEDVVDFNKECKKYRHKSQRNIIISSHDIDANTRLVALEEKVWAWDINHLNQIFDVFSKPRII